MKKTNIIIAILLALSISIAGAAGYMLYTDRAWHKKAADEYTEIKNRNITETTAVSDNGMNILKPYPEREIDFASLKKENPDCIGWIYFPFTGSSDEYSFTIDYPVAYEHTYNQYLKTTFTGEHNGAGCIFMDNESNPSLYGYNDFIYGHHMRDGSMFGSLEKIHEMDDLAYIQAHPQYMYIYTPTACHKYIMIAYEQVKSSKDKAYGIATEDSLYDECLDNIKSLGTFMDSDEIAWDGRPELMNLSTCDGPLGTKKRFIVHFAEIMAYSYDK